MVAQKLPATQFVQVVEAMFAKTATIKKLAIKAPKNPDPDSIENAEDNSAENTEIWKGAVKTQNIAEQSFQEEAANFYGKLKLPEGQT